MVVGSSYPDKYYIYETDIAKWNSYNLLLFFSVDLGALLGGLQNAANQQQQQQQTTNQQSNSNPVDGRINLGALFGGQNNQQQRFCP